jgi:Lon protease-like protein
MSELLPLFPLGTVLFPGMTLPLRVFEERYRQMVADLLAKPEAAREFGVVAIRKGREVATDSAPDSDSAPELHEIGCVARLRESTRHPDGRFDLVAIGTRRFRLLRTDDSLPYYQGEVEVLPEQVLPEQVPPDQALPDHGPPDQALPGQAPSDQAPSDQAQKDQPGRDEAAKAAWAVRSVQAAFRDYLNALADRAGAVVRVAEIPDDPILLSYVVAAGMIIDLPERQALLAAPHAVARLKAERSLLTRERAMLRLTTSRPAPDLSQERFSPN